MRRPITITVESDTWRQFQGIAKLSSISPSSVVETIFQAFLTYMKAGDNLRLELSEMVAAYADEKNSFVDTMGNAALDKKMVGEGKGNKGVTSVIKKKTVIRRKPRDK